tara:strand:+ start:1897 stop:2370 length:474 start_codon:yes stop_codon:yes gene_type:complete
MKIKITKKLLKEDDTEKKPRGDRTQKTARGPEGEEYMTPDEKMAKYGPLKGEPTKKVKVPWKKESGLPSADYGPGEKEPKIVMPRLPMANPLDDDRPEMRDKRDSSPIDPSEMETEDDTDYEGSPVPGTKEPDPNDPNAYFYSPLQEIAKRHFKKSK